MHRFSAFLSISSSQYIFFLIYERGGVLHLIGARGKGGKMMMLSNMIDDRRGH